MDVTFQIMDSTVCEKDNEINGINQHFEISIRIEDRHENQLGLMWLLL